MIKEEEEEENDGEGGGGEQLRNCEKQLKMRRMTEKTAKSNQGSAVGKNSPVNAMSTLHKGHQQCSLLGRVLGKLAKRECCQ